MVYQHLVSGSMDKASLEVAGWRIAKMPIEKKFHSQMMDWYRRLQIKQYPIMNPPNYTEEYCPSLEVSVPRGSIMHLRVLSGYDN